MSHLSRPRAALFVPVFLALAAPAASASPSQAPSFDQAQTAAEFSKQAKKLAERVHPTKLQIQPGTIANLERAQLLAAPDAKIAVSAKLTLSNLAVRNKLISAVLGLHGIHTRYAGKDDEPDWVNRVRPGETNGLRITYIEQGASGKRLLECKIWFSSLKTNTEVRTIGTSDWLPLSASGPQFDNQPAGDRQITLTSTFDTFSNQRQFVGYEFRTTNTNNSEFRFDSCRVSRVN